MPTTQIVLVDQTHSIDPALLQNAAQALNSQVTENLPRYWSGISAAVSSAPTLAAVPHGAWPVFLVRTLPPGEGGSPLDKPNQPYAKVIASAEDESWTLDASHEIIEMLVDPYGNRMQTSQAIAIDGDGVVDAPGTFSYLVEACDPCEANSFGYDIAGIALSDFITPNYYDASVTPGTMYSFKGNLTRPRQLLQGGYISFQQSDGSFNQILWVDPGPPVYRTPIVPAASRSLREDIHRAMGAEIDAAKHQQRRRRGGLPEGVQARVSQQSARRGSPETYERRLRDRYGLHSDS